MSVRVNCVYIVFFYDLRFCFFCPRVFYTSL